DSIVIAAEARHKGSTGSGRAQVCKNCVGGPAIDLEFVVALVGANQFTGVRSDLAVDLLDLIAVRLETFLNLGDRARLLWRDAAPRRLEIAAAIDTVGEVADEDGVEVGHVVGAYDLVVLEHEERGAVPTGRAHEIGLERKLLGGPGTTMGA